MSTLPNPNEGGDFVLPPEGPTPAICYRVIDIGTQTSSFQGEEKHQHKVIIGWELKGEETIMDDGQPMSIHQRYTWSMFDRAILRQHLESWRGQKFTERDFGPGGFDIKNLLGKACLLNIVHNPKGERTYANISAITKLPKGMTAGSLVNNPVYLWLSPEGFDRAVFDALSDGLKRTIEKAPEYVKLKSGNGSRPAMAREERDEIPF
jgi:hypothetical protein